MGVSIITSQLIAAALRVATLAATAALLFWRRRTAPRRPTQAALAEALRAPAFELDARYGEHLNVVFVTLLLCGGVPAAYLSAALWFGVAYWTEKWELLRLSRRPVAYGGDLAEAVNGIVPFAAVGRGRARVAHAGRRREAAGGRSPLGRASPSVCAPGHAQPHQRSLPARCVDRPACKGRRQLNTALQNPPRSSTLCFRCGPSPSSAPPPPASLPRALAGSLPPLRRASSWCGERPAGCRLRWRLPG